MDFARQQRDPKRHVIGISFVIALHVLIIYAMMTGLARKAVEVIKKPIDVAIIEEVKPPPPPPLPPPPPKKIVQQQQAPPPPEAFVPPPEIKAPPTLEPPPIVAIAPTPPLEPRVIAPPAPPVVEAPPAPPAPPPPPKPAVRQGVSCGTITKPDYPRAAIKQGIQKGRVMARLTIDERGNVLDVAIVSADPPRHFDRAAMDALATWKCAAEGARYQAMVEVNFSLTD